MISLILGVPGAGKTTLLAKIASDAKKKGIEVYSNVYIEGCRIINAQEDVGKYFIEKAIIIIDEGGSEYDNRSWKTLKRRVIRYMKLHRHYATDIYISSQDVDIDKKIRELLVKIWIVRKSRLPKTIKTKLIRIKIDIDENKKAGQKAQNIIKTYSYVSFLQGGIKRFYAPKYWKMFDSYYKDKLMIKSEWKRWTKKDIASYTYDLSTDEKLKQFEKG